MNMPTLSRRAILAAAVVVPALGIATGAEAFPAAIDAPDRTAWDQAFAVMQQAVNEDAAYDPIYMKTYAAFAAEAPAPETVECRRSVLHPHYQAWKSDDLDQYEAAWLAEKGRSWNGEGFEEQGRRQIAQVREFRRLRAAAERRHNMPAIEAEWERLGEIAYQARWTLFHIPAPDHAALAWKAEHLFGESVAAGEDATGWSAEIVTAYMADVRRLLPTEA